MKEDIPLKPYSSKDMLRLLLRHGWQIKAQHGSQVQLVHSELPGKVTVPHPKPSLDPKTLKSILRQAGLTMEAWK